MSGRRIMGGPVPSSLTRVLLDPDPTGGSAGGVPPGGGPAPTPSPAPSGGDPPSGPSPNPSQTPSVNDLLMQQVARAQQLESQLAEYQRQQEAALQAQEAARLKLIAEKEGAEKALEEQRKTWEQKAAEEARRAQELQTRFYQSERDRTLATSMAGVEWHDAEAAATARRLLADDFETRANADGSLAVVEKATGRLAAEVIAERISKPPYTYLQRSRGGGTGPVGGNVPPSSPTSQPTDYSSQVIAAWRERQQAMAANGMPALGLGLQAKPSAG